MGFSRGGQAALYASLKCFHRMWNRSGIEFAAYIPFYPDCATTFVSDTDVADRPIRIFGGTPDDYNPIALCKAYVGRLKAAGRDVEVTEYPNAPHNLEQETQHRARQQKEKLQREKQVEEERLRVLRNLKV
jgi:predicted esterase